MTPYGTCSCRRSPVRLYIMELASVKFKACASSAAWHHSIKRTWMMQRRHMCIHTYEQEYMMRRESLQHGVAVGLACSGSCSVTATTIFHPSLRGFLAKAHFLKDFAFCLFLQVLNACPAIKPEAEGYVVHAGIRQLR